MSGGDAVGAVVAAPLPARTRTLDDGTVVGLRAMVPSDGPALLRFHHGLTAETTYRRFFNVHPELSDSELHRFTHVDHRAREALVATVDGEIVAVARFDRLRDEHAAEVAFVVTDRWQGHGLGTLLMAQLVDRARALGIERFVADTLPQNHPMLAVFRHSGLPMTTRFTDGVIHVDIDLTAPLCTSTTNDSS